jgi:hypothetical protein
VLFLRERLLLYSSFSSTPGTCQWKLGGLLSCRLKHKRFHLMARDILREVRWFVTQKLHPYLEWGHPCLPRDGVQPRKRHDFKRAGGPRTTTTTSPRQHSTAPTHPPPAIASSKTLWPHRSSWEKTSPSSDDHFPTQVPFTRKHANEILQLRCCFNEAAHIEARVMG